MASTSTAEGQRVVRVREQGARPTPSISSAIRIDGKDSITSHTRMMKASVLPPT